MTITVLLGLCILAAFVVAVVSLILLLLRWNTPKRRTYAVSIVIAIAVIPCLKAVHHAALHKGYLPALAKENEARANEQHEVMYAESTIVDVGSAVPDFSLTTTDGDTFSTSKTNGEVIMINFYSSTCGPCLVELPVIEDIWADHGSGSHFKLIVVGREETPESVRAYCEKNGFTFPAAADPDRNVYALFADSMIPRTYIVSADGTVVYSKAGFRSEYLPELHSVLETELAKAEQADIK